ncbi:MAG: transposase [Deltaproteobacteria bacterium]|nr:transposase [Deltaproteobacteria bacterium]
MTNNAATLEIYRRWLPHWRLTGGVYFVTWRLHPEQTELAPVERDVIVSALHHFAGKRYEFLALVVMPNHVHVLVKPHDGFALQGIVHSWKSFTAYRLQREFGRIRSVWQDEYFDRIVRDEAEFLEKANYIFTNPAKVFGDQEYPWVWVKILEEAGTEARPTGTEARPTSTEAPVSKGTDRS